MFETITHSRCDIAARHRIVTTKVSVVAHVAILTAVIVVPLWYFMPTPALPRPSDIMAFVVAPLPPPPPPAPPPPARAPAPRREPVKPAALTRRPAAPIEAPSRVEPEKVVERAVETSGVLGGVEGGVPGGVIGGIVGGLVSSAPPPPPPPPPEPAPVRVGGQIEAPALIARVVPEYPALAQAAQLEGVVILEATVDERGRVESVKVLRSAGLLDGAAIDAVRQWRYSPLTLNGRPTPFVLTVTVQFHLGHNRGA